MAQKSASAAATSPKHHRGNVSDSDNDGHDNNMESLGRRVRRENDSTIITSRNILLFLIAFRILNALSIKTFFQPDEYFQSLEPAWEWAFGADSGAWITWASSLPRTYRLVPNSDHDADGRQEWKNQLRSSIHPAIFAGVYWLSSCLSRGIRLAPDAHADLLIAAPKVTQALFAALGDYYTWKLGERVYGQGSSEAWATVCSVHSGPNEKKKTIVFYHPSQSR